jgi:hypothetical protein
MSKLQDYELEEMFKDFLDETVEIIEIFGMQYSPSYVLKECDPIAYRVTLSDWLDTLDDCEDCDLNPTECTCDEI